MIQSDSYCAGKQGLGPPPGGDLADNLLGGVAGHIGWLFGGLYWSAGADPGTGFVICLMFSSLQ